MSERYQKTFISVTEFVESWDKELYELTNLDFFIYRAINYLGNQLEKRYFIREKNNSPLYLDFDNLGTACFNIGDAFESFLKENCIGSCSLNCPKDLDNKISLKKTNLEENLKQKLFLIQAFDTEALLKEECFRICLMNYVIIDTLIQFYNEEYRLELSENDFTLLELAEFIEEVLVEFTRFEGRSWLHRPFETALNYFDKLLQTEADEETKNEWKEENNYWDIQNSRREWEAPSENIDEVFSNFTSDEYYNPPHSNAAVIHDIGFFKKYLLESTTIKNISELNENHLAEFFSVWLVKEFVLSDEKQIPFIFRATARFITYIYHNYNINLKREFLKYYDKLKTDLPRVVQATNTFIAEYDLLEALLTPENSEKNEIAGFFEITAIPDRTLHLLNLQEIRFRNLIHSVKLGSQAFSKLHKGDILHASIITKTGLCKISDIQFIYPGQAKKYIKYGLK